MKPLEGKRWTSAAPDQPLLAAILTLSPGEAVSEDAALQVSSEITFHPGGGTETRRVDLCGLVKEGLQVMLDHGVERCGGGPTGPVDRSGSWASTRLNTRSANRRSMVPWNPDRYSGFRLARAR